MIIGALLLALIGAIDCRVTFTHSQFLDGADLKIVSQTEFACSGGCMVYSTTENANLAIVNKATGIEFATLDALANYNNAKDRSYLYGMTLPSATYILKNKAGLLGTIFGLYVVSNDAPNYGQTLRVADAFSTASFTTNTGLMTIMTRGTGIRMVTLNSANSQPMTPRIFATGYDAVKGDNCRAVYEADSLSHAQQSQIDVIGPIATIRFDGLPALTDATVKVSGDVMSDASELRNSLTISSPGFHGCSQDAGIFSNSMNKLDRRFKSDLNGGVDVRVRAGMWLPDESDALFISGLQDQTLKLMGVVPYNHDFLVAKVDLQLSWQRTNPKSNFAVQMDATKSAAFSSLLVAVITSLCFLL